MKVNSIQNCISFGRALTSGEVNDYSCVLKAAKEKVGQTGKSIFIMPSSALPQSPQFNSGIGHYSSDLSQEFLQYMKTYIGFNIVEDLPPGQIEVQDAFNCAYRSSAFALGNHQINPELLATDLYANLLTSSDLQDIARGNDIFQKDEFANFKNVFDKDGALNSALKKAYNRFLNLDKNNSLVKKYDDFIRENADWLNFQRAEEASQDFFKFKQFLAEDHLKITRKNLHNNGLKLCGDCLIGFSLDEVKAFPEAFMQNASIGWNLPTLNFEEILDDNSAASKLLRKKVKLFARRYDMLRFDVGWAYVTPRLYEGNEIKRIHLGSKLLDKIEEWVKEVKGDSFDVKNNLVYEFEAAPVDFIAFENGQLIDPLKNRAKVFVSTYMHSFPNDCWGYNKAFLDKGMSASEYVLGVGNHDPQPLRQIANGVLEITPQGVFCHKTNAIKPLSEIFNISAEILQNPIEFAKAKWAETMLSKHNHMFFMDVFGREERFDMQSYNTVVHPEKNYAYKLSHNYKSEYHNALASGYGFNIMDALEKTFRVKGLDSDFPELFKKIQYYNKILQEPSKMAKNKIFKHLVIGITFVTSLIASVGTLYSLKKQKGITAGKTKNIYSNEYVNIEKFLNKNL